MKKLLLSLAAGIALSTAAVPALAAEVYSHDMSILPAPARAVINDNFKSGLSVIKVGKEFRRVHHYVVVLKDGTEVTFDTNGRWTDVETADKQSVPVALIEKNITDYVAQNTPDATITGIERDRSGYDVTLSTGREIHFDRKGKVDR